LAKQCSKPARRIRVLRFAAVPPAGAEGVVDAEFEDVDDTKRRTS
jgi:hypothetical protein